VSTKRLGVALRLRSSVVEKGGSKGVTSSVRGLFGAFHARSLGVLIGSDETIRSAIVCSK
jgi:hypothetical protein